MIILKARDYIEHNYLPWILFLDKNDTINHYIKYKEEYLFETYNHISKEFKAIEFYELYMFRIQFSKLMLPSGIVNIITAKLPEVKLPNDAGYLVIIYSENELLYYTVDFVIDTTFQIRKYSKDKQTVIDTVSNDFIEVISAIKADLLTI